MGSIDDEANAEAFATRMDQTAVELRALVKTAQALPDPSAADQLAFNQMLANVHEKAEITAEALGAYLETTPGAQAVG